MSKHNSDLLSHFATLKSAAEAAGQGHLFTYYDELNDAGKTKLLMQIADLDFAYLGKLSTEYVINKPKLRLPDKIEPANVLPAVPTAELAPRYQKATELGRKLIREGKVAAFTVAGGQGTRLGFDGPKGCFRISPLTDKPLFQLFAEHLLGTRLRYGAPVPWYIMTSPFNDAATRHFLQENHYFGLPEQDVTFFTQGTMPAFGLDGKILLAGKDELALSPDGHGGSLLAMRRTGMLDDMARRGVEILSYFQVDNPLVHCVEPLFIGLHAETGSEMSSRSLKKATDTEKVGNFCYCDGRMTVIEYSDLPDHLAHAKNPDGSRKFDAGSIAIHVLSRPFIERITGGSGFALPWHRADKKVPYLDCTSGHHVKPEQPNAVKLECFVFDAIPLAHNPLVLETLREEEFSPVKNPSGVDSAETSRRDQIRRYARWLESAGISVPRGTDGEPAWKVEISPLFALDADQTAEKLRGQKIMLPPGAGLVLG